jgi:hypothetical protein
MATLLSKQQVEETIELLIPRYLEQNIEDIASKLADAENPNKNLRKIAEKVQLRYNSCFTKLYHSFIHACEHFSPFYNQYSSTITINRHKKDNILGYYIKSTEVKNLREGASLINDKITEICFGYDFSLCKSAAIPKSFNFNSLIYITFDTFNYIIEAENCVIRKPLYAPLSDIEILNIIQSLTDMHQKSIVGSIKPVEAKKTDSFKEEEW